MLGNLRESQLKKAFDAGLIPIHVCNSIRTNSPLFEDELNKACTAISEGYEDGLSEYQELYAYLVHFWDGGFI